jgi:hypothetical protein
MMHPAFGDPDPMEHLAVAVLLIDTGRVGAFVVELSS